MASASARRTTARCARRLGRRAEVGPSLVVPVVSVDGGGDRVALEHAFPEPLGEVGDSGVGISGSRNRSPWAGWDECRASVVPVSLSEQIGQQSGRRLLQLVVAARSGFDRVASERRSWRAGIGRPGGGRRRPRPPARPSGSQDRSLPRFQRLVAPGIRCPPRRPPPPSTPATDGPSGRSSAGLQLPTSSRRRASVNELVTPTLWRVPASSYSPSSSEPTIVPGPFLCQRNRPRRSPPSAGA